jgi:hypothetical protein
MVHCKQQGRVPQADELFQNAIEHGQVQWQNNGLINSKQVSVEFGMQVAVKFGLWNDSQA